MYKNRPTTLASLLVILFGVALFFWGTDGFRAFTAESARVAKLMNDKPKFPEVTLEDSYGRKYSFREFQDQYVLITFFYTSCATVCPQLESNMAQVYRAIPDQYIGKDIVFLSISFDPERDDPATLNKYKDYFGSDGETWRMARIPDQTQLQTLLDRFGVIVIPDGEGNFAHNSAFYLINRDGYLVEVMDYTKIEEAKEKVVGILEQEKGMIK